MNTDIIIIIVAAVFLVLVVAVVVMRGRKSREEGKGAPPVLERELSAKGPPLPATKEVFVAAPAAEEAAREPVEKKKAIEPAAERPPQKQPADTKPAEPPTADKARETPPVVPVAEPPARPVEVKKVEPVAPKPSEPKPKVTPPDVKPTAPVAPVAEKVAEPPPRTMRDGLGRTRKEGFIAKLGGLFKGKAIDQDLIDEIEEVLFTADIGVRTAERLLSTVRDALSKKELKDADRVWALLRAEATAILAEASGNETGTTPKIGEPHVTMVLGVNGTGKTTSIGKLAHQLVASGKSVALIAGDTFRAAAAEQLEHWGRRVEARVFRGGEGADPASVVFDGVRGAVESGVDYVLVDTAGRLHTQVNLMEELKKVRRVMGKAIDGAPHEVLMVLDATTGQNAISQAKMFKDATAVTGIILTKLDGTAKGGVVLGVCDELRIPIRYVGIGERVADLRDFDPREFVDELFTPPA